MDVDILIIGSGPAGTSAALPLVEAGHNVVLVDAGDMATVTPPSENIGTWRERPYRWRDFLGIDLGALQTDSNLSPKFTTPLGRSILDVDGKHYPQLTTKNFVATRTASTGGLSNIWGAFCSCFSVEDWPEYSGTIAELDRHYRAVASRIGISGLQDDLAAFHGKDLELDPPTELSAAAAHVLAAYEARKKHASFVLGRARNAVITRDRGSRRACAQCGMCLLGCSRKSIYNANSEIVGLKRAPNFRYLPRHTVTRLVSLRENAHEVEVCANGIAMSIRCRKLVLAAGTINTTALVADYHQLYEKRIRLLSNPVGALASLVPRFVGSTLPLESFGLGQLSFRIGLGDENRYATGVVYGADTLPIDLFATRIPLSAPVALRLSAALAPALLLATCYLPGSYSANTIEVSRVDNSLRIHLSGDTPARTREVIQNALRALGRELRKLGALTLPGSMTLTQPGGDAHLAGTLPMGGEGFLSTDMNGMLRGTSGVYVVDGSVLPELPAKHCTFTIMANADRIGKIIASVHSQ